MSGATRTLTALYEVRLQRKLFVTSPLQEDIPNPHFALVQNGLEVAVLLLLDEIPRQESPSRGLAICQVSTVEIRVTRHESIDLPFIVPIPQGQGPELLAWSKAQRERVEECANAALIVLNRLLGFFKYGLRNPLLEPFTLMDLLGTTKWLNEHGEVIESGLMSLTATWSSTSIERTLLPERYPHLQYCLENEVTPSLVEEILLDSMGALEEKNLRQAIIEAAVCAEVATREAFKFEYLDEQGEPASVPYLLSKVSRAVSGCSFDIFDPKSFSNITLLFRARNKGAHEGKPYYIDSKGCIHTISKQTAAEWIRSVEILLFWLEQSTS
ncbi:MAG TPA: hypothetical protein VFE33_33745 [Thermoanaerobaculia bacterium]|nr:hypothetical protein [Thermoanaerobaculia bacterium]